MLDLHRNAVVVDCHNDLPVMLPAHHRRWGRDDHFAQWAIPELRAGGVDVQDTAGEFGILCPNPVSSARWRLKDPAWRDKNCSSMTVNGRLCEFASSIILVRPYAIADRPRPVQRMQQQRADRRERCRPTATIG